MKTVEDGNTKQEVGEVVAPLDNISQYLGSKSHRAGKRHIYSHSYQRSMRRLEGQPEALSNCRGSERLSSLPLTDPLPFC